MSGLSLYVIEEALLELVNARDELTAEIAAASEGLDVSKPIDELKAELAAVDKTLAEYLLREIGKVDSIHSLLRWAKATASDAAKLAKEYTERRRRAESTVERVEAIVLDVMRSADKKKLEGTAGRSLNRQANGGLAPLQVDGWNEAAKCWSVVDPVIAEEFLDVTLKIPCDLWVRIFNAFTTECRLHVEVKATEPAKSRIRAALAQDCALCEGRGKITESADPAAEVGCNLCGGSGKRIVAGARLAERGEQLRLR